MNRLRLVAIAPLAALLFSMLAGQLRSQTPPQPPAPIDDDFRSKLPRIPPKPPSEALKTFRTQMGFRVELVACEPLIRDPVAIDFDEDGHLFVIEFPEYNVKYVDEQLDVHGVVKRLEDSDGDGRYDRATVYVDDLTFPTAVVCYDGGVFVGAAPDILFCKDTDGDGRADVREKVFTGFAREVHRAGQAQLNSFRWGLDNRFHLNTNFSGGFVRRADDKQARPVDVRSRGFLFDPRRRTFEVASGGGQHGLAIDDWGREFLCRNSEPFRLLVYDDRYASRNPFLAPAAPAVNIAADGKYTKLFRISPDEPWRVVRSQMRVKGVYRGAVEGEGKASGYFTAATGVTAYRGDAWPDEYRGSLLVGEAANNLIHRARLEPNGVSFVARRADSGSEFLASTDNWFRPVQLANGPDGALYVVDMYRNLIEGAAFLPPQVLRHIDVAGGSNRGRIYRIVHDQTPRRPTPKLSRATTAELVALLAHQNGWHRETAARLLYQRQDPAAIVPLKNMANYSPDALARLHARYALAGLAALDEAAVLTALDDTQPAGREHALRLAERFAEQSPAVRRKLESMTGDTEPRVRLQLLFSLGSYHSAERDAALAEMLIVDGDDPWMRLAALSSLNEGRSDVLGRLIAEESFCETSAGQAILQELTGQIGKANRPAEIESLLRQIDTLVERDASLARRLLRTLVLNHRRTTGELSVSISQAKTRNLLDDILQDARTLAFDIDAKESQRVAAIGTLRAWPFAELKESLGSLLEPQQSQRIQSASLETLRAFHDEAVADIVLQAWSQLSPTLRSNAQEVLLARPGWAMALLDQVRQGTIARTDVDPARLRLLLSHPEPKVRRRAQSLLDASPTNRRGDVVAQYRRALKIEGDVDRGRELFRKTCTACHRLQSVGTAVGADLQAVARNGLDAVLLNILDPNREVKPEFVSYVLLTQDGIIHTGMIVAETANSVTLRRPDGTNISILRIDIDRLRSTGVSFMPEGLEKQVDVSGMADLLAYLNSIR